MQPTCPCRQGSVQQVRPEADAAWVLDRTIERASSYILLLIYCSLPAFHVPCRLMSTMSSRHNCLAR
jgi:hypothetical protein